MLQLLKNPVINFILQFLLSILLMIIITEMPSLLDELQPDSSSYINFQSYRKSIYPLILDLQNSTGLNIILLQKFIFSYSVVFLIFTLINKGITPFISLVFFTLLIINIYYVSYTKTILPEALFFSSINFFSAFILKKESVFKYIILGFLLGIIFNLKAIGPVISIGSLIVIISCKIIENNLKKLLMIIIPMISLIFLENTFFYNNHNERNTVFYNSVIGKLLILSGKDSFVISEYPKELNDLLGSSKLYYSEVHKFLGKIKNPILRADYMADYEVHAQYLFLDRVEVSDKLKNYIKKSSNLIFLRLLSNNPLDYLILTCSNYIGMWSTGMRYIYQVPSEIPYIKELERVSGYVRFENKKVLLIAQFFFILLFIFSLVIFFYALINFKRKNLLFYFSVISQLYLITVAMTNVATIRYLMPVYPLLLLSVVFLINNPRINK